MDKEKAHTPSSSKSNFSRLQSLPSFKKKMRSGLNSEIRPRQKGLLTPGSSRKKETDGVITPEIAAVVVRQYLLPMFESDTSSRQKSSILNSLSEETHRPLEAIAGTVYGELKLADSLMTQLTDAREEIEKVTQSLKFAEQERQSVYAELENVKKQYQDVMSGIDIMNHSFQDSIRTSQNTDLNMSWSTSQLNEYRRLYSECEAENKVLNTKLHDEKALNDKRKNTAAELEQGNALLNVENEIMAERLQELYKELDNLPERRFVEEKLSEELEILIISLRSLADFCNDLGNNLANSLSKRDELKSQYNEICQLTEEIKAQRDKLVAASTEHINKLKKDLAVTNEQREEYRSKLATLEKNYKDLTESYDKMRQKLKQWKQRGKQYGENEEKTCVVCRKTFTENENYNWSCKTHTGKFSKETNQYWCCGKTGKDSTGCKNSKHRAKDEEEAAEQDKEDDRLKYANARCSSCKEIGHKANECPKDPNVIGVNDPVEEIKRIEELLKKKKAAPIDSSVNQRIMNILAIKYGEFSAFSMRDVSSGSEIEEGEETPENYVHDPYKDIKGYQNGFHRQADTIFTNLSEKK